MTSLPIRLRLELAPRRSCDSHATLNGFDVIMFGFAGSRTSIPLRIACTANQEKVHGIGPSSSGTADVHLNKRQLVHFNVQPV